jgi:thioredoxin reductase (NADPH)
MREDLTQCVSVCSCISHHVHVIGGANSAGQAAVHPAEYAAKVTVLVRGASLEAGTSRYLVDEIRRTPNIEARPNTRVLAMGGDERLEHVTLLNEATKPRSHGAEAEAEDEDEARFVFTFIGARPRTGWLDGVVALRSGAFVAGTAPYTSMWEPMMTVRSRGRPKYSAASAVM